ncbi:MAG: DUF3606 domain-containing protein [Massilia sp.]
MNQDIQHSDTQERSIYLHEEWEVAYWTRELGVSKEQLLKAVQQAGTGASAVRRSLGILDAT